MRFLREKLGALSGEGRAKALAMMARLQHRIESFDDALRNVGRALDSGLRTPEVRWMHADVLRHLSRDDEALSVLEGLAGDAPDYAPAFLTRGVLMARSGEADKSLVLFDRYFDAVPEGERPAEAYVEHGRALRVARRFEESASRIVEALELDPFASEPYSELSQTLFRARRTRTAKLAQETYTKLSQRAMEEHVAEGLQRTGATALSLTQAAINAMARSRFLTAWRAYEEAVDAAPTEARIRVFFAELALRFHQPTLAAKIAFEGSANPEVQPKSGLLWVEARAALAKDDAFGALTLAQSALGDLVSEGDRGGYNAAQAPSEAVLLLVVESALQHGELETAQGMITSVSEPSRASWRLDYWVGRTALAAGEGDRAVQAFRRSFERGGQSEPDLGYWNARAVELIGRKEDALKQLRVFLDAHPLHLAALERFVRLREAGPNDPWLPRLEQARAHDARRKELERIVDGKKLGDVGAEILELGKILRGGKDPRAFDHFALAADLLPTSSEPIRYYMSLSTDPGEVFVRLHHLRRWLAIEPDSTEVLGAIASIYLELGVRLDEAERLAERLHELSPSARSYRLRAEIAIASDDLEHAKHIASEGLDRFPRDARLHAIRRGDFEAGKPTAGETQSEEAQPRRQ